MNCDSFKDRLKIAIGGESNRGFSEKCGFSEGTLRRYLTGDTFPPLDTLSKIADVSGYSLAWLASGEGSMKGYAVITKDTPDGFGRAKELTFKIHPDFSVRLQKELGSRSIEWLAEASKLPVDRITSLLIDNALPTVDELIALAEALRVSEIWLAEGDAVKTATRFEKATAHEALRNRLKFKNDRGQHLNVEYYGSTWDIFKAYVYDGYMPTDEELKALCRIAEWDFVTGKEDTTLEKGIDSPVQGKLLSDEELIGLIYEAVDEVAEEWGNDESVISSKEKGSIAKQLFRIFSKKGNRQWVTKETMAEQTVILYLLSSNRDKVAHLINKLDIKPSDNAFQILQDFMELKDIQDDSQKTEGNDV